MCSGVLCLFQSSMLRCLETLAKNLDDSIQRLESGAGKVSGRSARIKRRMDMMLEEINGVQVFLDSIHVN